MAPEIMAAIVSAVVSLIVLVVSPILKSSLDGIFLVFKLDTEHQYAQRKQIKNILSKNKIHLMNASEALNSRLWNFSQNYIYNWHYVEDYSEDLTNQNYFVSFTYRLISFFAWQRKLDNEMIFLDTTIASKKDLIMIKFLRLFQQIMCDVKLFNGLEYDHGHARDHFFNDNFEGMVSEFIQNGSIISFSDFNENISKFTPKITPLMDFINGIDPEEERLRWEKIQILHLCVLAFLNSFGYDYQYTSKAKLKRLAKRYKNNRLLKNFVGMIAEYKLDTQKELRKVLDVFNTLEYNTLSFNYFYFTSINR